MLSQKYTLNSMKVMMCRGDPLIEEVDAGDVQQLNEETLTALKAQAAYFEGNVIAAYWKVAKRVIAVLLCTPPQRLSPPIYTLHLY